MNTDKKISFVFSKSTKKPSIFQKQPVHDKKVELVECLEGQSIKVKDAVVVINEPLVIPIKENKRNLLDRIREARAKQKNVSEKQTEEVDNRPYSELTLDELAARELINDAKKRAEQKVANSKVFVLPIKEEKITEGEIEPTIEDYESVPISDYGMAMLRGMGWKEGMAIGKNPEKSILLTNAPELRPKGLGLGANKMVKTEASKQPALDKNGKELVLKRDTYAKIIAGSKKGYYCVVQGLDDEAGTVIVKTSLNSEVLTLNEFLLVPVTKDEYARGSKMLNAAKYEEFKEKLDKSSLKKDHKLHREEVETSIKSENPSNSTKYGGRSIEKLREKKSENSMKHSSRDIGKFSDSDSSSSSDYERRRKQHKKKDKRSRKDKSRSPRRSSKKSSGKHKRYDSSSSDSYQEDRKSKSQSHSRRSSSRDKKHSRNKR